jgi:hypothetical protein
LLRQVGQHDIEIFVVGHHPAVMTLAADADDDRLAGTIGQLGCGLLRGKRRRQERERSDKDGRELHRGSKNTRFVPKVSTLS